MSPPEKVIADKIAWLGDSKPHETAQAVLEALKLNGWLVVPAETVAAAVARPVADFVADLEFSRQAQVEAHRHKHGGAWNHRTVNDAVEHFAQSNPFLQALKDRW